MTSSLTLETSKGSTYVTFTDAKSMKLHPEAQKAIVSPEILSLIPEVKEDAEGWLRSAQMQAIAIDRLRELTEGKNEEGQILAVQLLKRELLRKGWKVSAADHFTKCAEEWVCFDAWKHDPVAVAYRLPYPSRTCLDLATNGYYRASIRPMTSIVGDVFDLNAVSAPHEEGGGAFTLPQSVSDIPLRDGAAVSGWKMKEDGLPTLEATLV